MINHDHIPASEALLPIYARSILALRFTGRVSHWIKVTPNSTAVEMLNKGSFFFGNTEDPQYPVNYQLP